MLQIFSIEVTDSREGGAQSVAIDWRERFYCSRHWDALSQYGSCSFARCAEDELNHQSIRLPFLECPSPEGGASKEGWDYRGWAFERQCVIFNITDGTHDLSECVIVSYFVLRN